MTYREAAQAALDVQDASNLSGVVHTFAEVVSALWAAYPENNGTTWVNEHPICVLFIQKLFDLSGTDNLAWDKVKAIAQGK